jgi:hypothetical protein
MNNRYTNNIRGRLANWALAFLAGLGLTGPGAVFAASVSTDHFTYLTEEDFTVYFQGGPGNKLDWIGVYPDGTVPGTVNSTRWLYVDGTQGGNTGLAEGSVTFSGGLTLAGDWVAYLLLDDGYTIAAETKIRVVDPWTPFTRLNKATYSPGESISVAFTNGPGNAKDWIGIYPQDRLPGNGDSLLWAYVNGSQTSGSGLTEGVVTFPSGLATTGTYIAYLLLDDGYDVIASEPFTVSVPQAGPRVLSIQPADNATNAFPEIDFVATITNGVTALNPSSVKLYIDDTKVDHGIGEQNNLFTITFTNQTVLASLSTHTYRLEFSDDGTPAKSATNAATFTVAGYTNIVLPSPLSFEDFESTAEGALPAGWTPESYTDVWDPNIDLQDLNSAAYANWTVVNRERFTSNFLSYTDHTPTSDYKRVLTANPANVVNGHSVRDLAIGKFAFGDSGYRDGSGQFVILYSPDYDLSGKTNVHLSFHSIWEQNQDSIGAVEYSIDQGKTWLPAVYMLHSADVLTNGDGTIDPISTFETPYGDVPIYTDPITSEQRGGYYGAYIGATNFADLAPFISARVDDDPVGSKRVELIRLQQADNQSQVRLRFAHAGTDSWYFGIDNVGLYSLSAAPEQPVSLSISRSGDKIVISWPIGVSGYTLEQTDDLASSTWTAVNGVSNNSVEILIAPGQKLYRLRK